MQMNTVKNAYIKLRDEHPSVMDNVNIDMSKLLSKNISGTSNEEDMKWTKNYVNTSDLATEIINQVSNNELKSAASVKAYWTLAKCLEGLDEKTINQRNYNKTVETSNSEIWSYIAFSCYQKKVGIPINNEVPMYFQTNERWSRFRYGRRSDYTDNDGDDNRVMSRNSRYSYSTFYEAGCGPSSVAMVLSYLYKKYITPMDVRNRLEDNNVFYRDDANGGSGTIHAVLTASVSEIFNVNCQYGEMSRTNANVRMVLKSLIDGNPVVAICHGENSSQYPNNSSHFTKTGHYIVLAGVDKNDIANINMDNFDRWTNDQLNNIRIYVCDPAYYHQRNATQRTCTTPYRFNDFTSATRAGADSFWIYTKDDDVTYDNDEQWDYRDTSYTETFKPQDYYDYDISSNEKQRKTYTTYRWEQPTWNYIK